MLTKAGVPRFVGALLSGVYVVLVGWAFAYAWFDSNIQHAGFVWIPFDVLTMPWSGFNRSIMTNVSPVAILGIAINAGILYLLGSSIIMAWRGRKGQNRATPNMPD
jgi:Cu/Ag efflux pump CusA